MSPKKSGYSDGRRLKRCGEPRHAGSPFGLDSRLCLLQNWLFFYFSLGGWEVGRVREWVDGVSEALKALTATFPF